MKNLITIILIAFAMNFTYAADTLKVVFYFEAQSATLTKVQEDSLVSLVSNYKAVSVVGYANQLPNMTTQQANIDLAYDRAVSASVVVDCTPTAYEVKISNFAKDRRVEITFVTKEKQPVSIDGYIDINGNEVTIDEIRKRDQFIWLPVGYNPFNNEINSDSVAVDNSFSINGSNENSDENNNVNSVNIEVINLPRMIVAEFNCTNQIPAYSSTHQGDIVVTNDNTCGCSPVGGSLRDTWALYKSYQDSAKSYVNVDVGLKDIYTLKAREVRKCWKVMHSAYKYQSRMKTNNPDFDISKHMLEKEVSTKAKVESSNSKKVSKRKHTRLPKRPFRLNDNVWIKLFPFSAC